MNGITHKLGWATTAVNLGIFARHECLLGKKISVYVETPNLKNVNLQFEKDWKRKYCSRFAKVPAEAHMSYTLTHRRIFPKCSGTYHRTDLTIGVNTEWNVKPITSQKCVKVVLKTTTTTTTTKNVVWNISWQSVHCKSSPEDFHSKGHRLKVHRLSLWNLRFTLLHMSKKKSCVPVYCLRARKTPSSKLPHLLIYVMVKCSEVELSNLLATYELYNVKKPQRRLRVFDTCWSSVTRVVESSFQKPYLTIT